MFEANAKTKSREIAELLIDSLLLPNGHTVKSLFGNGDEASDLEAMTSWVEAHLNEADANDTLLRLKNISQGSNVHGDQHASM